MADRIEIPLGLFVLWAVHSKSSISERPHIMRLGEGFEPNGQSKDDANEAHDQQTYYQVQIHLSSHELAAPESGHLHICESSQRHQLEEMTYSSSNSGGITKRTQIREPGQPSFRTLAGGTRTLSLNHPSSGTVP